MEEERVDELLQEVIAQAGTLGIPVSAHIRPHVTINRRAVSRFGCCHRKGNSYTIELSAKLLQAEEWAVRQTLAHEVLHTCPGCANHGVAWKGWAAKMNRAFGYAIARTDTPETLGVPAEEPLYLLVCTKCGTQISRRRQSVLVKHPERYRCRCGGSLERRR